MKKKSRFARYSLQDKALLLTGYILLGLFVIAIVVPMCYIVVASFMDPITLQNKGITFDFSKWTLTAYQRVISNAQIWIGFKNAVVYSVIFTIVSVLITLFAAYPMSRADFKGRGFFNVIFMITMFFGGGLIPTYLLISNLGLLDSMWAVILPGAFSVWNMIIARTFYQGIPSELREAAEVDGATSWKKFFKVTLPLLGPSITTCVFMSLTNAVKVFDIILALTKGGPGGSTYSVTLDIYREAFQNNNYGLGSAKALVFFVIILVITQLVLKAMHSREVDL